MKTHRYYSTVDMQTRLPLGNIEVTPEAQWDLTPYDVMLALFRHTHHDWGDVDRHRFRDNVEAIREGTFVHSEYRSRHGIRFYVATQLYRARTVVLLATEV